MEVDLQTKELLAELIAKPEMVSQEHADVLNKLAQKYPYYQPLHLLIAKANIGESNEAELLAIAALYNGGNLLYTVIHHPQNLSLENTINFGIKADTTLDKQEFADDISTTTISSDTVEENKLEETIFIQVTPEEEVFDEISEINEYGAVKQQTKVSDEQETYEEIIEVDPIDFTSTIAHDGKIIEEELVIENIVNTDFFAFEEKFTSEKEVEVLKETKAVIHPEEYNLVAEAQTISNYNDEKLPYTFLWWLAKTRKEHEQIFQPYVTQKKVEPSQTGELQQQYVEHIFHLQSPFNENDDTSKGPLNRQIVPRGNDIINSFIKNDPQIKAPKAEQINTENKAKKSAEDHNDLVSETLAAIYIEQMLYHKAIETYEKLSLKFPEKSRYFADLIQSLEKKI